MSSEAASISVAVTGNLTLDGTLNVTDVGNFGPGMYTLMTYGGTLSDQQLAFGFLPTGFDYRMQTGAGSVNLVVSPTGSGFIQILGWRRSERQRRGQWRLGRLDGRGDQLDVRKRRGQYELAGSTRGVPGRARHGDRGRADLVQRPGISDIPATRSSRAAAERSTVSRPTRLLP